ncbi:MAG TPA: DUF554 domain-containing protein [Fimbriimonadaceae bacterium]|nr:DUF554 domain-containing protein [Fimbriimonadaceae bacterium]HRJ96343.1 DUF554 domain-containing protein [Fimbriimonadaceae bacterium]
MLERLPLRGTLLNTATIVVGALIGLWLSHALTKDLLDMATIGLGLVSMCIGIKMFLESKNVLIVAAAIGIGGLVGQAIGIHSGLEAFAEWARGTLGGGETFNEAVVSTSVLFCVGPMTLIGCLQCALEDRIELLGVKAVMDGIASIFFAATLGPGVLVTAAVVLVSQGALTLFARRLSGLAKDKELLAETSAAGGPILLAIGFGLAGVAKFPSENLLPALVLAPLLVMLARRFTRGRPAGGDRGEPNLREENDTPFLADAIVRL